MRPLFTIHAGEYLVASEIERRFRHANVWIPSRDIGVDLLVTSRGNRRTLALQVKFSKDFLVHMRSPFQKQLTACGWWTIDRNKLVNSPADYWVFVLYRFADLAPEFVIVRPSELAGRLAAIHGTQNRYNSYLWVTNDRHCWETRRLKKADQGLLVDGKYLDRKRDFTRWLDNWKPIAKLNRGIVGAPSN